MTTNIRNTIKKIFDLIARNKLEEAQPLFYQVIDADIEDPRILNQLATVATQLGDAQQAIALYSKLVDQDQSNAQYLDKLGQACLDNNQPDMAETVSKNALQLDADLINPYIRLGAIATSKHNFAEAIEYLEKAVQLKPGEPSIYKNLIISLRHSNRHDEATQYANKLLRMRPNDPQSCQMMGRMLIEMGDLEKAEEYLQKAIRLDKSSGLAYLDLSSIKKYSDKDHSFIKKTEKILDSSLTPANRSLIHFSLGKIYNDCNDWDKAFEHYRQGNVLKKAGSEPDGMPRLFKLHKKLYTRDILNKGSTGSASDKPVFIVGMPRSGTTLIEQIIASHPEGDSAGELNEIDQIDAQIIPDIDEAFKDIKNRFDAAPLEKYADHFLEILSRNREHASRIIDKTPENYLFLGLIHSLFPNAHIIHVQRHPLDTCLSCYFQHFVQVKWSFDLDWIGNQYRFYRNTMEYWKKVLPGNSILEINYDQFVGEPETHIRKIIDFLDLPWDDACLAHHKNKKAITTASLWQARQPVYSSSKKRWVNYAKHLEPLANQLIDYLDEEDVAEFARLGIKLKKKKFFLF